MSQEKKQELNYHCLVFCVGGQEFAIDILKVQEIREYHQEHVTRVAHMPKYIQGLINLRGQIIPVIDLRIKLKVEEVAYSSQTVVIILGLTDRIVGIVVDSVSNVELIARDTIEPPPNVNDPASYLTGLTTYKDQLLQIVDVEKLVDHEHWVLDDIVLE